MRLMRSSTMRSSKSVANMGRWRMLSSTRYGMQHAVNTTDEKTLAGEARWLWRRWSACQNFCRIPWEYWGKEGKEWTWRKVLTYYFVFESSHLSFQIFRRPDSFGPDLRSRDVRPARFFSISNLLWASRNFLRFKSDPKVLKSKRPCSKHKWLAQRPRSMFSHFGYRLIIYMKVTSSCVSLRNTIQMWIHKVNENIE